MKFSLQTRFYFFLLLPVTLILLGSGYASLQYARSAVQEQWTSVIQLRLEKTAHQIQMRLDEKQELMDLITGAEDIQDGLVTQAYLIQRLSALPGVSNVEIQPIRQEQKKLPSGQIRDGDKTEGTSEFVCLVYQNERSVYSREKSAEEGAARKPVPGSMMRTVCPANKRLPVTDGFLSMAKKFGGSSNSIAKRLVVTVRFDSLLDHVLEIGKWADSSARLVTQDGAYLARTDPAAESTGKFGESGAILEQSVLREMKAKDAGIVLSEGYPPEIVAGFHRVPNTDWYLVLFAQGSHVFAPVTRFYFNCLLAGLGTLLLVALLIRKTTRTVSRQISGISEAASKVEAGDLTTRLAVTGSDEIADLQQQFNGMIDGLKRKDLIEQTFGRYVDRNVAAHLLDKPESLRMGGETHVVTILMADLRGFTQAAEKLRPEKVIKLLNRHFSRMIGVIGKYEGIIVDFYGDSVLTFFNGLESDVAARAADAVQCALEMQREAAALSEQNLRKGLPALPTGIGIHTGEVVVGNIGSQERAKYGIVGSAVNETDRIQSMAEGGTIMISRTTYELVSDRVVVGDKCRVALKGLKGTRDLYLVAEFDMAHQEVAQTVEIGCTHSDH